MLGCEAKATLRLAQTIVCVNSGMVRQNSEARRELTRMGRLVAPTYCRRHRRRRRRRQCSRR